MKKLSEYTMDEYIRILDGDTGLLNCSADGQAQAIGELQYEFNSIASPKDTMLALAEASESAKLKITVFLLSICKMLCVCGAVDDVKCMLSELGINAQPLSEQAIKAVITERLKRAKDEMKRGNDLRIDEHQSARSVYEKLTATLMSHFKFQIDLRSISASLYANLIVQCDNEVKALMSAMKK